VAEITSVKGLRELGIAMQSLSADMAGKIARQATAAGAGVVRKAARDKAPRDSGNLRAAIIMKRIPKRQTRLTEEYIVTPRKGKTRDAKAGKAGTGKLGKDAFYARFVEFGTVKMPASPFIRPALENNVKTATDAIAKRLKQRLDKVRAK
jgi:HK97 gp10 family phage protein